MLIGWELAGGIEVSYGFELEVCTLEICVMAGMMAVLTKDRFQTCKS